MAKRLKPRLYRIFCSVCKQHYEYTEISFKDALQKFSAYGHDNTKRSRLSPNYGRKV